jgi:hypothetical protein
MSGPLDQNANAADVITRCKCVITRCRYQTRVREAVDVGELVVVFLHWGCNWDWMVPSPSPASSAHCAWGNVAAGCPGTKPWGCDAAKRQAFGRAMVDAGAAVVWGTSSHHIQPVERHVLSTPISFHLVSAHFSVSVPQSAAFVCLNHHSHSHPTCMHMPRFHSRCRCHRL